MPTPLHVGQAFDTAAPSLSITDDTYGTAIADVRFWFDFSEEVSGFTVDDISVTNGTKGTFSGSGDSYSLIVSPLSEAGGSITVDVDAAVATDAAGNGNTAATQASQSFDTRTKIELSAIAAGDGGFVIMGNLITLQRCSVSVLVMSTVMGWMISFGANMEKICRQPTLFLATKQHH